MCIDVVHCAIGIDVDVQAQLAVVLDAALFLGWLQIDRAQRIGPRDPATSCRSSGPVAAKQTAATASNAVTAIPTAIRVSSSRTGETSP